MMEEVSLIKIYCNRMCICPVLLIYANKQKNNKNKKGTKLSLEG
jgi:hypothetical protein